MTLARVFMWPLTLTNDLLFSWADCVRGLWITGVDAATIAHTRTHIHTKKQTPLFGAKVMSQVQMIVVCVCDFCCNCCLSGSAGLYWGCDCGRKNLFYNIRDMQISMELPEYQYEGNVNVLQIFGTSKVEVIQRDTERCRAVTRGGWKNVNLWNQERIQK